MTISSSHRPENTACKPAILQVCNQQTQGDSNTAFIHVLSSPITHTFATMIDNLNVQTPLGPVSNHHYERLAQVSYSRFSHEKTKPTTTYIDTPLTGAQAEVRYIIKEVAGRKMGYLEFTIALASCTVGHNLIHAGLASIRHEIRVAAAVVRVLLATLGFSEDEIKRAMAGARFKSVELTWHTLTASEKARVNAQLRTIEVMKAQRRASRRHDIQVKDVDIRDKNDKLGLLVELKSGSALRQYGKADMPYSRSRRGRQDNYISPAVAGLLGEVKAMLGNHLRNEIILTEAILGEFDLLKPKNWNEDSVKRAIGAVWEDLGFSGRSTDNVEVELSSSAQETLDCYHERTLDLSTLSPSRVTRDRKAILEATGIDILDPKRSRKPQIASVGRQQSYDRHWEPKDHLRDLVLCERTASALENEFAQGLQFLLYGELPDFVGKEEFVIWFKRWNTYAEREHLNRALPETDDLQDDAWLKASSDHPSAMPAARSSVRSTWGIGTVPVIRFDDDESDPYAAEAY